MDAAVSSLLRSLNKQQQRAVELSPYTHCLILAGAGCGKTAVLTRRIAWCAGRFFEQGRILALTFTRKAAEEMRERTACLPGMCANKTAPCITTFHGLCRMILLDRIGDAHNYETMGYTGEPRLLARSERLAMLARMTTREQRALFGADLYKIDCLLECYAVNKKRLAALSDNQREVLNSVAARLRMEKAQSNRWEFSDMMSLVAALFEQRPEMAAHYRNRFSYILIDEFQDTNPLQIAMVKQLTGDTNRVFAVGDDDQAIYGFRGADAKPVQQFDAHFSGARILKLEMNYRSRPMILRSANRVFADKPAHLRKRLRSAHYDTSAREKGPRPRKCVFADAERMTLWFDRVIDIDCRDLRIEPCQAAALFRLNETAGQFRALLSARRAPDRMPAVMTVHASKGLEFPVVFLFDLEESVFPLYRKQQPGPVRTWGEFILRAITGRRAHQPDCDLEEERRLFYVGVTRAQHRLYGICIRKKLVRGRPTLLRPSRFLSFL